MALALIRLALWNFMRIAFREQGQENNFNPLNPPANRASQLHGTAAFYLILID